MKSPLCGVEAIKRVESLLRGGVAASRILVVSPSLSEAKVFQHVLDLRMPIGNYELMVGTHFAVSREVLHSTDHPLSSTSTKILSSAATVALVRRVLLSMTASPFRPPNDPYRYAEELSRAFFRCRYYGVELDALRAAQMGPATSVEQQDRLRYFVDAYAAFQQLKSSLHVYDLADVAHAARSHAADTQVQRAVQARWGHVVCPDTLHSAPPALELLTTLFGSPALTGTPSPLAPEGTPEPGRGTVDLFLDTSPSPLSFHFEAAAVAASSYEWSVHPVDNMTSFASESVNSAIQLLMTSAASPSAGKAVRVRTKAASPLPGVDVAGVPLSRSDVGALPDGVAWLQQYSHTVAMDAVAPANGAPPTTPFAGIVAVGVQPNAIESEVVMQLLRGSGAVSVGDASSVLTRTSCALRQAAAVGIVCSSTTRARELAATLRELVERDSRLQGHVEVLNDFSMRLADVRQVRVLLSLLAVMVDHHDTQALFHVLSSPPYSVSHTSLQTLLNYCKKWQRDVPVWVALQELAHRQNPKLKRVPTDSLDSTPLFPQGEDEAAMLAATPHLYESTLRFVRDVQTAERFYAKSGRVGVLLSSWLRTSSVSDALLRPRSYNESVAAEGVAALLLLVADIEAGMSGAATSASASSWSRGARYPGSAGESSGESGVRGIPFVLDAIRHAVLVDDALFSLDGIGSFHSVDEEGALEETSDRPHHSTSALHVGDATEARTVHEMLRRLPADEETVKAPAAVHQRGKEGASSGAMTLIITTAARAMQHHYDALVICNVSDATFPGSVRVDKLVPWEHFPVTAPYFSADTRASHLLRQRARFASLLSRSRGLVVCLAPSRLASAPHTSKRRSRFMDELFGAEPRLERYVEASGCTSPAATPSHLPTSTPTFASLATATPLTRSPVSVPATPPQQLPDVSYSRVFEHEWCPYRYYLSRVVGVKPAISANLLYGSALHAAVAAGGDLIRASLLPEAHTTGGVGSVVGGEADPLLTALTRTRAMLSLSATEAGARLPSHSALVDVMIEAYRRAWRHGDATHGGGVDSNHTQHDVALAKIPLAQAEELDAAACAAIEAAATHELSQLQGGGVSTAVTRATPTAPCLVEFPFRVQLRGVSVPIIGVIDRVDASVSPAGELVLEIREFKSSQQWRGGPGAAPPATRDSLQPVLYWMALKELVAPLSSALGVPVCVPPPVLESIETGKRTAVNVGKASATIAVERTARAVARISAEEFVATPSRHKCGMCSFQPVCPHAQ